MNSLLRLVLLHAVAVPVFLLTISCHRDPICYPSGTYSIVVDVDDSALYMKPAPVANLQLSLYDPSSGREVYKTFLSSRSTGLPALPRGTYMIAVWSKDAGITDVSYTNNYRLLSATSAIVGGGVQKIIAAPDHLLAFSSGDFSVPEFSDGGNHEFHILLKSVVDTWMIEVEGVSGLQWLSDASFTVSNQVKELLFDSWRPDGVCSVQATGGRVSPSGLILCPFGTFGMLPDGRVEVEARLRSQDGLVHSMKSDVTSQVRDPSNSKHLIRIHFPVQLSALRQGGLQPGACDWDEEYESIEVI
ncbi:MAG: DUF5119 domain-containing protein [Bacteroidales bacterium]|nr:DUF5119 domain-containing protein [Bacteroidales bacterium]